MALNTPMPEETVICAVCEQSFPISAVGSFGEDAPESRYPVCQECYHSGKHQEWREAAIAELMEKCTCHIAFQSNHNLAEDIKTLRDYKRHTARIQDGICPNGCAALIVIDAHNSRCDVCGFHHQHTTL